MLTMQVDPTLRAVAKHRRGIASARSHAFTLRCCEPTWTRFHKGSRPTPCEVEHVDRHLRIAAETCATAAIRRLRNHRECGRTPWPGAARAILFDFGGTIDREQANAELKGARMSRSFFDRIAIGDALRRRTGGERHLDLREPMRSSKHEPIEASSDNTSGAGFAFTA